LSNRPIAGKSREIPEGILEEEFRKANPQILYKYRNWLHETHKDALRKSQIWLSSPKQLNDLYDIRLAYTFDSNEVYKPEFFAKLRSQFSTMTSAIPGTRDFEVALDNHYEIIKADPQEWFNRNQTDLRNGPIYEEIGLFSTSENPLNELMWAHYGDSHHGYCIGYDSYLLWQAKRSFYGAAHYVKEPIRYSFLDDNANSFIDMFIKSEQWSYEKEYRFWTFVSNDNERLVDINIAAIREIILGNKISTQAKLEIIQCLKDRYRSKVSLFKIKESRSGLTRTQINY
jgi:hypothetical protein